MKIVIINKHVNDTLGGSEIQCDLIARSLMDFGHYVVYIAIGGQGAYDEVPYKVVPSPGDGQKIAMSAIEQSPHVIYWRFNKNLLRKVFSITTKHKIPFVFAVSNPNDFVYIFPEMIKNAKTLRALKSATIKMIKNLWNHKPLRKVDGITTLNPSFLPLIKHQKAIAINNSMIKDPVPFNWPNQYIVWVANLKPQKRPEICIHLAKHLANYGVDLLMVGKIQSSDYNYFNDKGLLPKNLHYLGPKTPFEVNGILSSSIALVHTCRPEGFGNNFIQAWLQGKPTVSLEFDPGGFIEKKKLGMVAGNNQSAFINQVITLVHDSELARQMGERAKKFAEEQFDPVKNTKKLEHFLYEVVQDYAVKY